MLAGQAPGGASLASLVEAADQGDAVAQFSLGIRYDRTSVTASLKAMQRR